MKKDNIIQAIFGISFIFTIIGISLKIMHLQSFFPFLTIGVGLSAVYTIVVLMEILPSQRLNTSEKMMWTVGLIFFNVITGLLYFTGGRKRVTG